MTFGVAAKDGAAGAKGKLAASASFLYKKIIFPFIPMCMSPASLKGSIADALCRSEQNNRCHEGVIAQLDVVGGGGSETSSFTIIDRASLEERLRNLDAELHDHSEPVVALSVHGWARGHERNVVEAVKRGLKASHIAVHEIVSPADVLVMFHDMTMGLNVEHLLGRMRHAAAYSNAQDVVLVLMECEKGKPSKSGNFYPAKSNGGQRVGERSWQMLVAAASLVVEYTYVTNDGSNRIQPHNEGTLMEIVNHVRSWVSGRDSIGMSVECSQQASVELGNVRKAPTISLGNRAVGPVPTVSAVQVNLSPAALASARIQGMNSAILSSRDSFGSLLDSCISISESDVPVVVSASSRPGVSGENVSVAGGVPPIEENVPLMDDVAPLGTTGNSVSHSLTTGRGYSAGLKKRDISSSARSLSWSGWDLSPSDLPQGSRGANPPKRPGPPKKPMAREVVDGKMEKLAMRDGTGKGKFPPKTRSKKCQSSSSKPRVMAGIAENNKVQQAAAQPNKELSSSSGMRKNEAVRKERHEKKSGTLQIAEEVAAPRQSNIQQQRPLHVHPNMLDIGGAFEMEIG